MLPSLILRMREVLTLDRRLWSPCSAAVPLPHVDDAFAEGYEDARIWADQVSPRLLQWVACKDQCLAKGHLGLGPNAALPGANFLAISGGGDQGAFAAGVLCGWSARGDRPVFEIVTGVSSGALAAPFAFLGQEADGILRHIYTKLGPREIYKSRGVSGLLRDAFGDNRPLKEAIRAQATPEMLDKIAAAFEVGRRLYVLTTNLDAQRPMLWDLTAIAASGRADRQTMFADVLLASAAIPGIFAPVYFPVVAKDGKTYSELHVDGGLTAQVMLVPSALRVLDIEQNIFGRRRLRNLYAIRNSKIGPEYAQASSRPLSLMFRSVTTMVKYQVIADLQRLCAFSMANNTEFAYCSVPSDLYIKSTKPFDREHSCSLFVSGHDVGLSGRWQSKAPASPFSEYLAGAEEKVASLP